MRKLASVAVLVRDYDEALAFYVGVLGFQILEDTDLGNEKRWVRVAAGNGGGSDILLARASTPAQLALVGNQTGGRVFLFLNTDDFDRDHAVLKSRGVLFEGEPRSEDYGRVAVFRDLYGNRWDLVGDL